MYNGNEPRLITIRFIKQLGYVCVMKNSSTKSQKKDDLEKHLESYSTITNLTIFQSGNEATPFVKSVHIWSYSGPHFPAPAFSRIRTEFGKIRSISPYSARMRENADQNNSEY